MPAAKLGMEISGKPTSVSQPFTADPNKLRRWAGSGLGVQGSIQQQVNRLFRTTPEGTRPPPHIMDIQDVTKGLGLEDTDRETLERLLTETRADFGLHPKTRVPRIQSARKMLSSYLQATKRISPDVRMEIRRRAMEWWRKYGKTTYEGQPMIRHIITKAQLESPTLIKAGAGAAAPASTSGGPYIGPRGGKYKDPELTQSWTDIHSFKLKVSGKDHEKTAKQIEGGIKKAADICQTNPPVCHGNLGIPRKDMPQLADDVIDSFLASFQKKGIKVTKATTPVGQLKATQGEINAEKVNGMANAYKEGSYDPSKKPIIVSKDGYVLDGHHRWAAMLTMDPGNKMRTYKVDTDIRTLLKEAKSFKGVKQAGFGAASDMDDKTNAGDSEDHKDVAEAAPKPKVSKAVHYMRL